MAYVKKRPFVYKCGRRGCRSTFETPVAFPVDRLAALMAQAGWAPRGWAQFCAAHREA